VVKKPQCVALHNNSLKKRALCAEGEVFVQGRILHGTKRMLGSVEGGMHRSEIYALSTVVVAIGIRSSSPMA
jgi:hypothetical protein